MSIREPKPPHVVAPRYLINGNAWGLSTTVTRRQGRDTFERLAVQGTSVLPAVGGSSKNRVDGRLHDPFVSFEYVETEADGDYNVVRTKDQCRVHSRSSISGLSVVDRFRASFVQASLDLRYDRPEAEPVISFGGTTFGPSITLDDETIHVHIDERLTCEATEAGIERLWTSDPEKYAKRFFHGAEKDTGPSAEKPPRLSRSEYMMVSIVDSIRIYNSKDPSIPAKAEAVGHTVRLQGFGTIYFGELSIRRESRKLVMMRFELGCADEGSVVVCGTESTAEFCPP